MTTGAKNSPDKKIRLDNSPKAKAQRKAFRELAVAAKAFNKAKARYDKAFKKWLAACDA